MELVIGLFQSAGIAEDACNRLRTEGIPDRQVARKILHEVTSVPTQMEPELAALTVDPLMWGDVRNTYVDYIHNGETAVLVEAATVDEVELATDVLRMFEPLVVDILRLHTAPAARSEAI